MATDLIGPIRFATATAPMGPEQSHNWAFEVLSPLPSPGSPPGVTISQKCQVLTVTVVPNQHNSVQALSITRFNVITMPSGAIAVNCTVTNKHHTSNCLGYKLWASVTVNEPSFEP